METNSTKTADVEQIAIEELYPALVQCFGTILCGCVDLLLFYSNLLKFDFCFL